jgi:hypothetical protein
MRALGIFVLGVVLLIGGGFALYKLAYPSYIYRFRLAIAVEDAGTIKTASSVIEGEIVTRPFAVIFSPTQSFARGDAVFLDLGNGRHVIALLACDPNGTQDCIPGLVTNLFRISGVENLPMLETLRGSRELTGGYRPTFVTFRDLNDPGSARVVRPDQFEKVFGPDVHFKRAWIALTDAPMTGGIEAKMPWWNREPFPWMKPLGNGAYVDTRPADSLQWNKRHFKREF